MTKGYNDNLISNTPHVRDQLSGYIDGLLAGDERDRVRAHIEECADCRADYIELRATQKLMQNIPTMAAPRAFTLTPEMAGQVRKSSFWERFLTPANSPRLATGSVVAFLLLFFFVAGNFVGSPLNTTFSKIGYGLSSGADAFSAEAAPPSAKQLSPTQMALAEATSTTAASSSGNPDEPATGGDISGATAPQPTNPTIMAEVQTTQVPPSGSNAQAASPDPDVITSSSPANPPITPNTTVADSGTGSPTTTTLDNQPSTDTTQNFYNPQTTDPNQPSGIASASPISPNNDNTLWAVLQIALLALALALAASAIIAKRKA